MQLFWYTAIPSLENILAVKKGKHQYYVWPTHPTLCRLETLPECLRTGYRGRGQLPRQAEGKAKPCDIYGRERQAHAEEQRVPKSVCPRSAGAQVGGETAKGAQLCLILCNPRDCSPQGSSVQGILQARILEWIAIPSSRGSSGIEPGSPPLQADSEPPGQFWENLENHIKPLMGLMGESLELQQ